MIFPFLILLFFLLFVYCFIGYQWPRIAIITVPLVFLWIAAYAFITEDAAALLYAVFLLISVLISIASPSTVPGQPLWPRVLARRILVISGVVTFLLICIYVIWLLAEGFLDDEDVFVCVIILFSILIFPAAIIIYSFSAFNTMVAHIIFTINSIMKQHLPLPMALESASYGLDNSKGHVLQKISRWLVQGYPLADALKYAYSRFPAHALAMIKSAERLGQLPRTMELLSDDLMFRKDQKNKVKPFSPVYPVVILVFSLLIMSGYMIYVLPELKKIIGEFFENQSALPLPTRIVFVLTGSILSSPVYWLIIGCIIIYLWFFYTRTIFRPRRPDNPYLISRIGDFIKWRLPVLHWFQANQARLQVVELLHLSVVSGYPLDKAIRDTLDLDVNLYFKSRIRSWLEKVERGENVSDSARQCKIGEPIAWAFDENINQGNTESILEMLESFYRTNFNYRVNIIRVIVFPLIILLLGITVGFFIYSMFAPAVLIINMTADIVYP